MGDRWFRPLRGRLEDSGEPPPILFFVRSGGSTLSWPVKREPAAIHMIDVFVVIKQNSESGEDRLVDDLGSLLENFLGL